MCFHNLNIHREELCETYDLKTLREQKTPIEIEALESVRKHPCSAMCCMPLIQQTSNLEPKTGFPPCFAFILVHVFGVAPRWIESFLRVCVYVRVYVCSLLYFMLESKYWHFVAVTAVVWISFFPLSINFWRKLDWWKYSFSHRHTNR